MSTNKSFSTETSERYARALFEISLESNELEKVETDLKNFVGLTMKNGSKKGYFVLDKPNKNCSAGSGDGSTGANFCIKAYQEFKLLNWDELLSLKGKWIDIIHNINFNSDPEKGYFKIWINGDLKVDQKGQTIWKTHGDVEKYFGKNRWDFKFGIYTTSKMAFKLYFDEIWIKVSSNIEESFEKST